MIEFLCVGLKLFLNSLCSNLNWTLPWAVIILTRGLVNLNNRYIVSSPKIDLKLNML